VRPYRKTDREGVRRVCCETGFMGDPVDPLFGDREVFADFFTRYYTDLEPEHCLVAEDEGAVVGYAIGSTRHRVYPVAQAGLVAASIGPRVLWRGFLARSYDDQSRSFVRWVVGRGMRETPKAPPAAAHFHVNLLPGYRNGPVAREIVFSLIDVLEEDGADRVYGQIQTFDGRRAPALFRRWGFELFDQRRISRFETFRADPVYVSTFVKELGG
jgi:hypothetical protein